MEPGGSSSLEAITYGNGAFVGAGSNARLVRSTDGIAWEIVKEDEEGVGRFRAMSFANGLFIAGGDNGLLYTSPDGITWTKPDHGETKNLMEVAYFNEQYVMLDTLSSTQLTTDFLTLKQNRFGFSGGANAILIVNDRLITVGRDGFLASSDDGVGWTERRESLGQNFASVAFGANHFVINDFASRRIFSSSNGIVWTQRYEHDRGYQTGVAFGGGQFCIMTDVQTCMRSEDGRVWQEHETSFSFIPAGIRYVNERFITVGRDGGIASSPDGKSWTDHSTGTDVFFRDIAYHNNLYIAVGQSENLYTSADLVTWSERFSGIEGATNFARIEVFKDQFFLFQSLGVPAVSADGLGWTLLDDSLRFFASATGVDPDLGVYTLTSGQVIYNTPDAELSDWGRLNLPVASNFNGMASGNGITVGVGFNGLIMSTPLESGGYNGWATEQFGSTALNSDKRASADPDGDGCMNLEEYARGTDPNQATEALAVTLHRGSFGPEVTWQQLASLADVQTVVEHSNDLETWSDEGVSLTESDPFDGREVITARVTGAAGSQANLYMRVRWMLVH